jgi:uncharacterized protein
MPDTPETRIPEPETDGRRVRWSRYNVLIRSGGRGPLLYNILSNSFAELDPELSGEIEKVQADPTSFDDARWPEVAVQLRAMKALISEREEADALNLLNLRRLARNFDTSSLSLTIAPTQACNFRCVYCYEADHPPIHMDDRTEAGIVDFIRRFGRLQLLHVTWYGGEPLLAFGRIRSLTAKIRELGVPCVGRLITNGYLLDDTVIGELGELGIRAVQVTVDGPRSIHDTRRPLSGGQGTFDRIVGNLERLAERWDGWISVRVNIDRGNAGAYQEVRTFLKDRLPADRARVYPGMVSPGNSASCGDVSCPFSPAEEAAFHIAQYREHGNEDLPFYPKLISSGLVHGSCMAHTQRSFVVGPTGDLFKCYHDLGVAGMRVGTVFGEEGWDQDLLARYMIGTDPFMDDVCRACVHLPLCGGGCPHFRMKKLYEGMDVDTCTRFKSALPEFLEIHYELKQRRASETAAGS